MAKAKKRKDTKRNSFIKGISTNKDITEEHIGVYESIDYPLFSFKYLQEHSIRDCKDHKFFFDFLIRLRKLSELGWEGIRTSARHSFGMEKIPRESIIPQIPNFITPDVEELHVFRSNGNNTALVGLQIDKIFHVLFIETKHGDIYKHQ